MSFMSEQIKIQKSFHPAWVEVDLGQFKKNLYALRRRIEGRLLCLCVKADAYGHGLCEIGKIALEAGVEYLCVACLKEGISLRLAGIKIPILVLGAFHEDQIEDLIRWNLEFTISSRWKADLVASVCIRLKRVARVHLEIDTGLQRTGVRPETAVPLLSDLLKSPYFKVVGVYSHLATADKPGSLFVEKQIERFSFVRNHFLDAKILWHLAASGGVLFYPDTLFDMVRVGLLSYGYFPDGSFDPQGEILPCFSVKAKVSYFKVVEEGEGISYSHIYRTAEKTRIVTVPLGYGDGLRRDLANRGSVLIRGKKYPIVGAICMDQFMVDIGQDVVYVGDEVVLIGMQGKELILLEEVAALARTISYDILCSWNSRLSRIYQLDNSST